MVRSKARMAGQHITIFSAPGMHESKSAKVHHAEAVASPALAVGTAFPSLLCIPDSMDQTMGQSLKVRTKQHAGGPKQGSPRHGLKHVQQHWEAPAMVIRNACWPVWLLLAPVNQEWSAVVSASRELRLGQQHGLGVTHPTVSPLTPSQHRVPVWVSKTRLGRTRMPGNT